MLTSLLENASLGLTWVAIVLAVFGGVFIAYIGMALGVALFHRDPATRRHATTVLRELLRVIARGRSGR